MPLARWTLPAAPSTDPSTYASPEDLQAAALFHGTLEAFDDPLAPGGYDGVAWTAREPAIAQCYIPAAGGSTLWSTPWSPTELAKPTGVTAQLLRQMGYSPTVDLDDRGRVRSWSYGTTDPLPTQGDVHRYVTETLGYTPNTNGACWIKNAPRPHRPDGPHPDPHLMPADYVAAGTLITLLPREPLVFADFAQDREGDLSAVDYHRHDWFAAAEREGFDGVRITDFAQSEHWGNVRHVRYGLLPRGLAKCAEFRAPAVHDDLERMATPTWAGGMTDALRAAHAQWRPPAPQVGLLHLVAKLSAEWPCDASRIQQITGATFNPASDGGTPYWRSDVAEFHFDSSEIRMELRTSTGVIPSSASILTMNVAGGTCISREEVVRACGSTATFHVMPPTLAGLDGVYVEDVHAWGVVVYSFAKRNCLVTVMFDASALR